MGELKIWVKIVLFMSSYIPLWIIFLGFLLLNNTYGFDLNHLFSSRIVNYFFLSLCISIVISLLVLYYLLYIVRNGNNPTLITIREKENHTTEFALYSATYLLPFLVDDFLLPWNMFALIVMLFTIGSIYVRSNMIHINPTFSFFRYRLYDVSDVRDNKYLILSRKDFNIGEQIEANNFDEQIYIDNRK